MEILKYYNNMAGLSQQQDSQTGTQQAGQIAALKMEPRHRKLNDDEHEDAEYIDEHNDDDEMMLTLPSVAQNGMCDSERREVWVTCYPDRAEFRICIPFGAKQGKQALVHG